MASPTQEDAYSVNEELNAEEDKLNEVDSQLNEEHNAVKQALNHHRLLEQVVIAFNTVLLLELDVQPEAANFVAEDVEADRACRPRACSGP